MPLPLGIDRPGGELALEPKLAAAAGRCALKLSRAGRAVGRGDALEPEQRQQRAAVVGLEPAVDAHVGAARARQDRSRTKASRLAGGAGRNADPHRADPAGEVELAAVRRRSPLLSRLTVARSFAVFCAAAKPPQRLGQRRRELLRQRDHAAELARIEIDRDVAARRRRGLDAAAGLDLGVAEIGDRQPLDRDAARRRTSAAP